MKNVGSSALALLLLLTACDEEDALPGEQASDASSEEDAARDPLDGSDDDERDAELPEEPDAAEDTDTGVPSPMDSGAALDAPAETDAAMEAGASDAGNMDAGDAAEDGAVADAAQPDASDAALDASGTPDAAGDAGADAGATCDDGNSGTEDYSHPQLGCGVRTHEHWVRFALGGNAYLELDLLHARLWSPHFKDGNNLNVTYTQLEAHCEALSLRGFGDFRVPSIDDVRTLAGGCPNTALSGSCPLSDAEPSCTTVQCGIGEACESCIGGPLSTGPNHGYYCRAEVPECLSVWTTTSCSDCSPGRRWFYGVINGNFYYSDASTQAGRCVANAP